MRPLPLRAAPLLLLALAAACAGPRTEPPPGPVRAPGEAVPLDEVRAVPQPWDGIYVLERVDGAALPAAAGTADGCPADAMAGTLVMRGGRFSFAQTLRIRCEGAAERTVVRRARGTVGGGEGLPLALVAEDGDAFERAAAVVLRSEQIEVIRVADAAGEHEVRWRLVPRRAR